MNYHEMEMRAVYAATLSELIVENPNVMCLEADLAKASGTFSVIKKNHPKNFINAGVAEANMIGIGAGLAVEGKIPFCASFTPFASRRVYDQVTISVAYANNNVKIVGTAPGITAGPNGGTHMCFQDLSIMRAMPNMHVYSPADAYELRATLKYMAKSTQPTYMQLIRTKMPQIFDENVTFAPGKAQILREGADVTLISTGYMTKFALQAAKELEAKGVSVDLIHCGSVKPIDEQAIIASAKKTGGVVTVETQNIIGGLGSAVCEVLSEKHPTRVHRLGIPDQFGEVATEKYLFDKHKFGVAHIVAACVEMKEKAAKKHSCCSK
jgi:transketolase